MDIEEAHSQVAATIANKIHKLTKRLQNQKQNIQSRQLILSTYVAGLFNLYSMPFRKIPQGCTETYQYVCNTRQIYKSRSPNASSHKQWRSGGSA